MLLIGHRGCNYPGYNQNTIRAFAKVTSEGARAIEFDVQRCSDGQLVVVHNLDLAEVSTGKGEVSSTDSHSIKQLYAGDPDQGEDRIPFLRDVFDFFSSCPQESRPAIHMELKGENTGWAAGELFYEYVRDGRLVQTDLLASSFNWQELEALRSVCPNADIALLDGAIRRNLLLQKTDGLGEEYFSKIFAYGNEEYMLPRYPGLEENLALLNEQCADPAIRQILANEIASCLAGNYYTDTLLNTACAMQAVSVNLWYQSISQPFIDKAHEKNLKVFVYTVNNTSKMQEIAALSVDGIFTDFYADGIRAFT